MKYNLISETDINASAIIGGCMWLPKTGEKDAHKLIDTYLDNGVNFFDHADIYFGGESEKVFGEVIKGRHSVREKIYLQSKCGIQRRFYDFSKDHILASVDNSLKRLNTEYLDILLLHRPDTLVEEEEIASAFDTLEKSGKVRYFGVSNQTPNQIELLKKYTKRKLVVNQLQFGLGHTCIVDNALATNTYADQSINRDSGILDYCRLNEVTIQAWSPLQRGKFEGTFINDLENYGELNEMLNILSEKYGISKAGIATAWILRHPANIQVVLGTTKIGHLLESIEGIKIELTRKEWYDLYCSTGNIIP